MRRAAAWDGAFPIDRRGDLTQQLSLSDMAAAIAFVRDHRTEESPFDIVHAGLMTGDRQRDIETARSYADIGVTWWLEHVYPGRMTPDHLRQLIREGPLRP